MLISEKLYSLFKEQILHENQNHNIYKNISSHLKRIGLNNLGKFFESQANGELDHRNSLIDYLTDLNIPIEIDDIPKVEIDISSVEKIAETALQRELSTTEKIKVMSIQAFDDEDMLSYDFLQNFIREQREELKVSYDLFDNIKDFDNDMALIRIFDQNYKI